MTCPHPGPDLISPQRYRWTGGPGVVWLARCGRCGADVLWNAEVPQDPRQQVPHARPPRDDSGLRGASPVPAPNGGPRGPSDDVSSRVMPTNLNGG